MCPQPPLPPCGSLPTFRERTGWAYSPAVHGIRDAGGAPGPAFGSWETTTLRCPLHKITLRRRTIEGCRIRDLPGPICQEWVWIVTRKLPHPLPPHFFFYVF